MSVSTTTLITGAASGLGWALAKAAFAQGHSVVLVDRDAAMLAEKSAELAAEDGSRVRHFALDLTDGPALDRLIETAVAGRRLDVLIHNARITQRSPSARTHMHLVRLVLPPDRSAAADRTL